MNIDVIDTQFGIVSNTHVALLQVDMDEHAENCFVMNRRSFCTLFATIRPPSGIAKVVLPLHYATANDLLVGIVDNDGEYNAAVADGVKAEIADVNTVDLSQ